MEDVQLNSVFFGVLRMTDHQHVLRGPLHHRTTAISPAEFGPFGKCRTPRQHKKQENHALLHFASKKLAKKKYRSKQDNEAKS